ncbi:MAG: excinuclease ABC subunit A [Oxalobacter sp.]|nr:MAG: excinuclease ABC subunit A [Oxalobacter sp.]
MKKIFVSLATLAAVIAFNNALARNTQEMYSIQNALSSEGASKLDPKIKLYFANQRHPSVLKTMGEYKTSKKTNGFMKADDKACNWAFISALLTMQNRARSEGGNAVINIKSNYENIERSSATQFVCGSGALMSGVAIKGTVVKLAP